MNKLILELKPIFTPLEEKLLIELVIELQV